MAISSDSAPRAQPAWRNRLQSFWRWWMGELAQLVPARFGGASSVSRTPLIAFDGDALVLLEARGASLVELARAPIGTLDTESKRLALRNLIAGAGGSGNDVRLCLARDEALLRRVSLPLATEENLPQVLAFEMDRLSPFRAEDVYFDHRVAGRDAAAGKVNVDLGVARRELVDPRVAQLGDWGANVEAVMLADDVVRSAHPLDLLPDAPRGGLEMSRERTIQYAMAGGVVLLLAVALLLPIWQKRETVMAMIPQVDRAKKDAEATDALARDLEKQVADYNFLLSKKHAAQPALAFVEEISRLLPDNTWVQQLDIRPQGKLREVQIAGETPSSSKLIEIFEQATTMKNAAPRGTVTRGASPGTERFLIAAEARPRALPEAVSAGLSGPAPVPSPAAPPLASGSSTAPAVPSGRPATLSVPPAPAAAPAPPPGRGAPSAPIAPPVSSGSSSTPQPLAPPVPGGGASGPQPLAPGSGSAPQPMPGGSVRPDGTPSPNAPPPVPASQSRLQPEFEKAEAARPRR